MSEFCKHGNLKGDGNCRECNPEIRSNKMKPCKNKDCYNYNYNELQKYNCNIWRLVTNCHVYLDKPKISAWELLKKIVYNNNLLWNQTKNSISALICNHIRIDYKKYDGITYLIGRYSEQKALEILQKIKGELE